MVILTIKFPRGTKTYDYLMKNPHGYKLDRSKDIKFLTGLTGRSASYNSATVVDGVKCDTLPTHVTTVLEIMTDNFVRSYSLTEKEIKALRAHISSSPSLVPSSDGWIEQTVTKEEFIQKVGYKSYLSLSFELRQQIDKGLYTISIRKKHKEE